MKRSDTLKAEVLKLRNAGVQLLHDEVCRKSPEIAEKSGLQCREDAPSLSTAYQIWYSAGIRVVRAIIPERLAEFVDCYEYNKGKQTFDFTSYKIRHHLVGAVFPGNNYHVLSGFSAQMQHQITILDAAYSMIDSRLSDMLSELQFDLFESELDAAEALIKTGQLRAGGAVCGVVLEAHLKTLCESLGLSFKKTAPTVSDYNDKLKEEGRLSTADWRLIQRLGDVRNTCVHSKDKDPTKSDVSDLLAGVRKVVAEIN